MQAVNTVTVDNAVVKIKRGPFGNKFTQHKDAVLVEDGGKTYVKFYALCTDIEPGRIYCCYATLKGSLEDCYTVN